MGPDLRVLDLCDSSGRLVEPAWLDLAEGVHRQLRPALPPDYGAKMARVFDGGGRMLAAVQGQEVRGVAVYRVFEDTHHGTKCYVDDLVVDESWRGQGIGRALVAALEVRAQQAAASSIVLDSGTQRIGAHAFYFREGFSIPSFNFKKSLK